jgi:hypothetical protein
MSLNVDGITLPDSQLGREITDLVIADKDPHFHAGNLCSVIRASALAG